MSERSTLGVSWFQVVASALAAVTAAWLASRLGVAGTLIGVAVASFVSTVGSAFYNRTLEKSRTLLVQTASGTIIQKSVQDGEIAEALEEAAEVDDSPVQRAEVVAHDTHQLPWRRIIATTVVVLVLALAAISTYELVTGETLGGSGGTTIGDTFGGSRGDAGGPGPPDEPESTPTPTEGTSTPTPEPSVSTPSPTEPTGPTPTPTQTTPAPTVPTPTPAE